MSNVVETRPTIRHRIRTAFEPSIIAIRSCWPQFVLIQGLAALFVFAYYRNPLVHEAGNRIARTKLEAGLPFAVLAGGIAGGLMPEIAKLLTGRLRQVDRKWLRQWLFAGGVYGFLAIWVDIFYRYQTVLFGEGRDLLTLTLKTALDMGVFSALFSVPFAVHAFRWRQRGHRWGDLVPRFSWAYYRDEVLPAVFMCWAFWVPVLYSVYALPSEMQFCCVMFAQAAWSTLFVFMATHRKEKTAKGSSASCRPN